MVFQSKEFTNFSFSRFLHIFLCGIITMYKVNSKGITDSKPQIA